MKPVVVDRQQMAAIAGLNPDRLSAYAAAGMPVVHKGGVGAAEARIHQRLTEEIRHALEATAALIGRGTNGSS